MGASEQNIKPGRYQVIPRVLVFAWRGESVLLLKIKGKGRWDGRYNGLGGHIERGETTLGAARRELLEESGLQADLRLAGTLLVDTGETPGIGLFIFSGQASPGELVPGAEGDLAWVPYEETESLPLLEDVPLLLARIRAAQPGDAPFAARSYYDEQDRVQLIFDE